jgi:uncharacterized protein YjbI with pentapeptide repeats
VTEKPETLGQWKERHPRWPNLPGRIEWNLERLVYWCRDLAVFDILEFAGRLSLVVGLVIWFLESGERTKQKHYRAWELINSARGSTGDGGRREALQDLNDDNIDMSAAPLAKAYLKYVQLSKAVLNGANLTRTDLTGADLTGADLTRTKLIEANLIRATLTGADLTGADLSRANLTNANLTTLELCSSTKLPLTPFKTGNSGVSQYIRSTNLTGVDLIRATLTGADLSRANLTNADLREANLFEADLTGANLREVRNRNAAKFCKTTMPDGTLNDRDCTLGINPAAPTISCEKTSAPE